MLWGVKREPALAGRRNCGGGRNRADSKRSGAERDRAISTTAEATPSGSGVALAYPVRSLWPDYTRAGIGLAIALLPMPWVPAGSFGNWLLGLLALLFGGFAVMTWVKHRSTVQMNPAGIRILGPVGRTIAWGALDRLALRFYSTRKERGHGWMQLKLSGGGTTITIDSNLDRFHLVAARAARAAAENALALDPTTLANLESLGVWPVDLEAAR